MPIEYQAMPSSPITAPLNILPDEIIILILSQHVLDLKALQTFMSVSRRMRLLCVHVLANNRLPGTQLSVTIDQEGKSRVTTQFEFSHFCPISLSTLYTSNQPTARRYYTDKACPVVRSMSMKDLCHTQSSSSPSIASSLYSSSAGTLVGSNSSSVANKQTCSYTTTTSTTPSLYHYCNAKKLSAQKKGIHILQVSPHSTGHGYSWKLAYRITDKHSPEYYLAPINISLGFRHLLKLDALNCSNDTDIETKKPVTKTLKNWVTRLF